MTEVSQVQAPFVDAGKIRILVKLTMSIVVVDNVNEKASLVQIGRDKCHREVVTSRPELIGGDDDRVET